MVREIKDALFQFLITVNLHNLAYFVWIYHRQIHYDVTSWIHDRLSHRDATLQRLLLI